MLLGDWPFNEDEASQAVSLSARLFGKALAFSSAMRPLRTASPVALTASVKGVASFGVNWTLEVRMIEMPPGAAVEQRNQGYYVAGTRISLDSVAWALKRGDPPDEILADFPALGSRQRLEAAVAFINSHPREIEAYLAEGVRAWEEARKLNPPELVERSRRFRERRAPKSA
jgi:uncharacterized protein (DUF433 family)